MLPFKFFFIFSKKIHFQIQLRPRRPSNQHTNALRANRPQLAPRPNRAQPQRNRSRPRQIQPSQPRRRRVLPPILPQEQDHDRLVRLIQRRLRRLHAHPNSQRTPNRPRRSSPKAGLRPQRWLRRKMQHQPVPKPRSLFRVLP